MPVRYSDHITRSEESGDFIRRTYRPSLVQLILLFLAALLAGIVVTSLFLSPTQFVILMTCLLGGFGSYIITEIQRARDLVVSTEYQNAMYASAMVADNRFTLIIRDGAVVYMDNGFKNMYPDIKDGRQLSLASLLKSSKVGQTDRDKILNIVQRGTPDKLLLEMRSSENRLYPMVLTIRPITKPGGFMLVQGRDYVQERRGDGQQKALQATFINPLLSKTSISMFANIMDRMEMGMYMIDMNGFVLYANPTLEKWLNFDEGEVSGGQFSLRDLLLGISVQDGLHPGDFEGENSLLKKQGGTIKAYINQKIIYGDNRKPLGCVAIITSMVASDSELKKKLW